MDIKVTVYSGVKWYQNPVKWLYGHLMSLGQKIFATVFAVPMWFLSSIVPLPKHTAANSQKRNNVRTAALLIPIVLYGFLAYKLKGIGRVFFIAQCIYVVRWMITLQKFGK